MSSTIPAVTIDDIPDRAPAARLSAERENEPLTGMVPLKAAATFASPWPINSWFSSQAVRVLMAMILPLDMASTKLTRAMTKRKEAELLAAFRAPRPAAKAA